MIKSVTVTNHLGKSIKLEMRFPEKSGFFISSIDGLGPAHANINMSELATSDGSKFNSARLNSRNIVLNLGFLGVDIESVRLMSYKYFPIKKQVKLLFETDSRRCEIYGNVESNEPNIFSERESTQISIVCPDPYFYSTKTAITYFSGLEPVFEFPFSNESLTENLLEMGRILVNQEQTVWYDGDADVGIVIYIHALGDVVNPIITNSLTREVMRIDTTKLEAITGHGIIAGDDIIISTVRGQKYIRLLRDGEYINILNCLEKNSDWFQISQGDNVFSFTADEGGTKLQFRIENRIVYDGV